MVLTDTVNVRSAGQEVSISYGPWPNDVFYLFFGFVPDHNPHDSLVLFTDLQEMVEFYDTLIAERLPGSSTPDESATSTAAEPSADVSSPGPYGSQASGAAAEAADSAASSSAIDSSPESLSSSDTSPDATSAADTAASSMTDDSSSQPSSSPGSSAESNASQLDETGGAELAGRNGDGDAEAASSSSEPRVRAEPRVNGVETIPNKVMDKMLQSVSSLGSSPQVILQQLQVGTPARMFAFAVPLGDFLC